MAKNFTRYYSLLPTYLSDVIRLPSTAQTKIPMPFGRIAHNAYGISFGLLHHPLRHSPLPTPHRRDRIGYDCTAVTTSEALEAFTSMEEMQCDTRRDPRCVYLINTS